MRSLGILLVIATFNLAQALLELDPDEHRDEADRLLLRVIEVQPLQLFEGMDQQRFLAVISEVAAVGQEGLKSTSRAPPAASRLCPATGATWPWPA